MLKGKVSQVDWDLQLYHLQMVALQGCLLRRRWKCLQSQLRKSFQQGQQKIHHHNSQTQEDLNCPLSNQNHDCVGHMTENTWEQERAGKHQQVLQNWM